MKTAKISIAVALAAAFTLAGAVSALTQSEGDAIIARVDGTDIRQSDLALAEADIGSNLPPAAPEARRDALLTYLIDVTILANAAKAKKVDAAPGFDRRLAFARQKVLMEALLTEESKSATNETAMRNLYDESVKKSKPEEEVRARHILVPTEEKAKEILAKLEAGGDFAELAKAESKDTGAPEGGDLGYFTKEQMVPDFAEVAFKLEKGALSSPVKTQFGWHIIRVEDKRTKPVPAYDDVKEQIQTYLARRAQAELVGRLRETAKIERIAGGGQPVATPPPAEEKK
jgi:peptidyl-prolyl cis-trans isomerase C